MEHKKGTGLAIGIVMNNIAIGVSLGIAFGIIYDANKNKKVKK